MGVAKKQAETTHHANTKTTLGLFTLAFVLMFGILTWFGYARVASHRVEGPPTQEKHASHTFLVDGVGSLYIWTDAMGKKKMASLLRAVPINRLVSVGVHAPGWPVSQHHRGGRFVADLSDAGKNDKVTAVWRPRTYVLSANHAADWAGFHALRVRVFASELANFNPASERIKRAHEAIKIFEKEIKPYLSDSNTKNTQAR